MLVCPSTYRAADPQQGLANRNLAPCGPETTWVLLKGERGILRGWWLKPEFLSSPVTGWWQLPLEGVRGPMSSGEHSLALTAYPTVSESLPPRSAALTEGRTPVSPTVSGGWPPPPPTVSEGFLTPSHPRPRTMRQQWLHSSCFTWFEKRSPSRNNPGSGIFQDGRPSGVGLKASGASGACGRRKRAGPRRARRRVVEGGIVGTVRGEPEKEAFTI